MKLKIKKLHTDAKVPTYAHPGDAGMDFYTRERVVIEPGQAGTLPTGIAMEIPDGYVGLVWEKSGLAFRHGIQMLGGVIDASFRGEITMRAYNSSDKTYTFEKGDKTSQMLIQPVHQVSFEEVEELSDTSRGEGREGSTGV
jgi:dUTP pyrophosphatase